MSNGLLARIRNYLRFEHSYFTIGGWRKNLTYFLKMGHLPSHLIDRIKFRIFPKLGIVPGFPTHLDIEVASACQMRCPMCYTTHMDDGFKGVMKWELFEKLISQAAAEGVYSVKFSWRGEPLLNKRIVDMVRLAKSKGIREVAFLTNAGLLTEKMGQELVDAGLDWMSVSADGTGDIYNRIRAPATFEETIDRVRSMKAYRDSKGLTRPLLRVQSVLSAVEHDPDTYFKAWEGIVDRINVIADELRDFNDKNLQWDEKFVCAKPWQRMTIAYDGKVHQCISDYGAHQILGDASRESLRSIWHGAPAQAVRDAFMRHTYLQDNKACRHCSYGVVMEQDTVVLGENMTVRRFKGIEPVVEGNEIQRPEAARPPAKQPNPGSA
jgi:radical SAM protein with 4Fe4S-binding SPASM domain